VTVAELIALLRAMPPDALVMTDAGEGAWAEAEEVIDCGEVDDRESWPALNSRRIKRRVSIGPKS
jgi:hypothetical protein